MSRYAFEDPTSAAGYARIALLGVMVGRVVQLAAIPAIETLAPGQVDALLVAYVADLLFTGLSWISVLLVAVWIYRASENAHVLSEGLEISPGWAVGWFFIPVASLWMPYRAMIETWNASLTGAAERLLPKYDLLAQWWFLWVFGSILGRVSDLFAKYSPDPNASLIAYLMMLVAAVMQIFTARALRLIIAKVSEAQVLLVGERRRFEPEAVGSSGNIATE